MSADRTEQVDRLLGTVRDEITAVLARSDRTAVAALAGAVAAAPRVFVVGEGRSGFMARAFAMRLMHLGLAVHVVGETTTPAVGAGDAVVAVSGSGTTPGAVRTAEQAAAVGAAVHVVTTDPASPLAALAATVTVVPAATKYRRPDEAPTVQPLSSLFDQATHVLLDVVCLLLAEERGVDNDRAYRAHANTE